MKTQFVEKLARGWGAAALIDLMEIKHYGHEILDVFRGIKTVPEAVTHLGHMSDVELVGVLAFNLLFFATAWGGGSKMMSFFLGRYFRVHDHPTWVFDVCIKDGQFSAFQDHLRFIGALLRKAGYCREIDSYGYTDVPSRMCVQVYLTKTAEVTLEEIKGMFGPYLCDVSPLTHL